MQVKTRISLLLGLQSNLMSEALGLLLSGAAFAVYRESCASAIRETILAQKPDIVILDKFIVHEDILAFAKSLKRASPQTKVVFLAEQHEDFLLSALVAGIDSCLSHTLSLEDLSAALLKIHDGARIISEQETVAQLLERFSQVSGEMKKNALGLTSHQVEILERMAKGLTYKEIGNQLGFSSSSIKQKGHDILKLLGVRDRSHAVAIALRTGLIS